jgi:hypothetical protein
MKPFQAKVQAAVSPLPNAHSLQTDVLCDGHLCFASPTSQKDLRELYQRMRVGVGMSDALQLLRLLVTEDQRRHRTTKSYGTHEDTPDPSR